MYLLLAELDDVILVCITWLEGAGEGDQLLVLPTNVHSTIFSKAIRICQIGSNFIHRKGFCNNFYFYLLYLRVRSLRCNVWTRAVDSHSFYADPDPAVFLNTDPNPDPDPDPGPGPA